MKLLLMAALVAASAANDCSSQVQHERAEERYKAFLGRMYPAEAGIVIYHAECVNSDSDGDGYVSCSATLHDAKGTIFRDVTECGWGEDADGPWGVPTGCRAPKGYAGERD